MLSYTPSSLSLSTVPINPLTTCSISSSVDGSTPTNVMSLGYLYILNFKLSKDKKINSKYRLDYRI